LGPTRQSSDHKASIASKVVPTAGESLRDGTLLELVRLENESRLLVWRAGQCRTVRRYENAGVVYEPVSLDPTAFAAIRFPSRGIGYGSAGKLFTGIIGALTKFSGIPSQDLTAAAFWILTSWFPDVLPVLPTLIVASPSSGEARKFFRILRCFCRRGVLLTELGPNGFLSLPMFLRPTLIVEQANLDRRMRGLFRAAAGMYVASGGEFLDLRCARAVFCEQDDLDADLHDGCLRVSLFPPATAVPAFDKSDEEKLAAEFLPRLLRFRCNNFRRVSDSVFDAPAFTTGIRDVARSLGACVVGDPKLEAGIIELLSSQDTDLRASFATRPDVAIIIAMLALLHERTEDKISVTKFTTFANAALRASGEIREYSPLEIGRRLSGLNIPRARVASGMIIDLTRDVSRRVHELKCRFGVVTTPASFPGCPDCEPAEVGDDRRLM
jgi:hypothetical protein